MKNGDANNRVSFFYGKVVESASFRMWNIYGHTIEVHYLSTIFRKMYDYLDRRKIITTFAPLLKQIILIN